MLGSKMLNNSHGTKLWEGKGKDERNMMGKSKKKKNETAVAETGLVLCSKMK